MSLAHTELDPTKAQIRLLRLCQPPTPETAPLNDHGTEQGLRYSLEVVSLNDNPEFVALSYVWGDLDDKVAVIVDGVTVQVTRNLSEVMRWHRGWRPDWPIWADAICINQADDKEKGHQIMQMRLVYREATKVICWLGPSTPRIEIGLRGLDKHGSMLLQPHKPGNVALSSLCRRAWLPFYKAWTFWRPGEADLARVLTALQVLNGTTEFRQLAYFRRMWTLHETLLPHAERIVCVLGGIMRDSKVLRYRLVPGLSDPVARRCAKMFKRDAASFSQIEKQILTEFASAARTFQGDMMPSTWESLRFETLSGGDAIELLTLLTATRARVCHDPRDKIFALLGLLCDAENSEQAAAREEYLAADPSKPVHEVVRDALYYTYHYEHSRHLPELLCSFYASTDLLNQHNPQFQGQPSQSLCQSSWLPDMARVRRRLSRPHALSKRPSECDEVKWQIVHHSAHIHDQLACAGRRLGQIVFAVKLPDTAQAAMCALLDILDEALRRDCLTSASSGHYGAIDNSDIQSLFVDRKAGTVGQGNDEGEAVAMAHGTANYQNQEAGCDPRHAELVLKIRSLGGELMFRIMQGFRITVDLTRELEVRDDDKLCETTQRLRDLADFSFPMWGRSSLLCKLMWNARINLDDLRGQTMSVLETGRFCICEANVEVGDILVSSRWWPEGILLRSAGVQLSVNGDNDADCEGQLGENHSSSSLPHHQELFRLVDWPYVDGFDHDELVYKDYAAEIAQMPSEDFVLI